MSTLSPFIAYLRVAYDAGDHRQGGIVSTMFTFRRTAYGYAERMLSKIGLGPGMTTGVARTVNR
jgi:hypothetical protein